MQVVFLIALILALVAGLLVLLRTTLLVVTVHGQSMAPTLQPGERILVVRRWLTGRLRRGQIVMVRRPDHGACIDNHLSQHLYIKRVVALAGETFTATVPTPESPVPLEIVEVPQVQEKTWHVPSGHIFICGDYREQSVDSRTWGPIALRSVIGVMVVKLASNAHSRPLSSDRMLAPGEPAPSLSARTVSGEVWTLNLDTGRPFLLFFIAPNRLVCTHLPSYLTMARKLAAEQNITTIFACDANLEQALTLEQEFQIESPVLVVPREMHSCFRDYRVIGTPAYCLIDVEGKVQSSSFLVPANQVSNEKAQDVSEALSSLTVTNRGLHEC